jgi:uncharacterized protein
VCNAENYPLLMKLFNKLNVPLKKTKMSFAAQYIPDNIEYSGSSLSLLFAHTKYIFNIRYIKFLTQLNQFNKQCLEVLEDEKFHQFSIEQYITLKGFNQDLLKWYLLPMSSALWSTPPETSAKFPVLALVRFFKNHGFLGLNTQFQWYTVDGGSEVYKNLLIESYKHKIQRNAEVVSVVRHEDSVAVKLQNGETLYFDKVIMASHADQTLRSIGDKSEKEHTTLSAFTYERNTATLHTDERVMPSMKKIWSSWNYRTEQKNDLLVSSCTYWMNSLQNVSKSKNYFLTINDQNNVDENKILKKIDYEHPIFTVEAMKMQKQLNELNDDGKLYFCGSYFRYGFHEDAFMSAVSVCEKILNQKVL